MKNPIDVFLFWELRGLSPNFHIHVYVSDLHIARRHMDVEIGTVAAQFPEKEYLFQIFGVGYLQCTYS
jgi:hypothetical protein